MTLLDTVRPSSRDGDVTVLVTGAGTFGASGIIKAIRRADAFDAHIVGVDTDPDAYGFSLVDTAETVPAGDADAFVSELRSVASRENADVIFPLNAADVEALSEAKPAFEREGIEVMAVPPQSLSITRDKGRLYDELVKQAHPMAPEFYRASSFDEFLDAVHALGYPDRRVCFKPPVSNDRRCFRVVDPDMDRFNALLNQKPDSTVTTLDDVLPVLRETAQFPELIVMEYLPGEEYTVDALVRDDETPVLVSRSHAATCDDSSFVGTVEKNPELLGDAHELCSLFGLEYNATFRFKYTADGRPKLVDVHPRISRSVTASVGAGANIPALSVQYAMDRELPELDIEWGTHVTRDWQDVFYGPNTDPTTI